MDKYTEVSLSDLLKILKKGVLDTEDMPKKKKTEDYKYGYPESVRKEYNDYVDNCLTEEMVTMFRGGYNIVKKDSDMKKEELKKLKDNGSAFAMSSLKLIMDHVETLSKLKKVYVDAQTQYILLQLAQDVIKEEEGNG